MTGERSSTTARRGRRPTRAAESRPAPPTVAAQPPTPAADRDAGQAPWPGDDPLELAAGYRLLAELFAAEPDEELLALAATVPALARHATAEAAHRYTDIFVINVYPFASVYLEPDGAIDGERANFTLGVLEALGLAVDATIAADHIAVLLAALAALLEREVSGADPLRTERARHAQRALLAEHLLPWAPHFLDAVERTDAGLYRAAAALARRILVAHAGPLFAGRADAQPRPAGGAEGVGGPVAEPAPAPLRGRTRTGRGAHADDTPSALLARLASPERCGFFLCRADIAELAAELGLAIRFGGRPFMLESLAQAAAQRGHGGVLQAALVRFAIERREALESWMAALPSLAPLWQQPLGRIDATLAGWQEDDAALAAGGAAEARGREP